MEAFTVTFLLDGVVLGHRVEIAQDAAELAARVDLAQVALRTVHRGGKLRVDTARVPEGDLTPDLRVALVAARACAPLGRPSSNRQLADAENAMGTVVGAAAARRMAFLIRVAFDGVFPAFLADALVRGAAATAPSVESD